MNFFQMAVFLFCGVMVGLSKTSLSGAAILAIPIMTGLFGGKASTGVMLTMLIMGDLFAVNYYRRHADWRQIVRLLPWVLLGIAAGLLTGAAISDRQFKSIISICVLTSLAMMAWRERRDVEAALPERGWLQALVGLASGFATMVGNAAGPIMGLYLLSRRLPKYVFIGTSAWFYIIVNLIKLPLHVFVWHTISRPVLALDAYALPAIVLGALAGVVLLRKIPERPFRLVVMGLTALAAVNLLI